MPASTSKDSREPSGHAPGTDPARSPRSGRDRTRHRPRRPARLADTPGPDPDSALADVRLTIGILAGAHGVRGEMKLRLLTDEPAHLPRLRRVFVGDEADARPLLGVRLHGDQALVRVAGVTTPEEAAALRGQPLRIAGAEARPLAPGEYFLFQLIGLVAEDEHGRRVGHITDILETGAHDVFVVTPDDGQPDVLLPNLPDVVLEIDPAAGRMTVRPLIYEGTAPPALSTGTTPMADAPSEDRRD